MTTDSSSSIIPYLFLVTFVLAIAFGIWQYRRARKAKVEHHQSADARLHGDAPGTPASAQPERERSAGSAAR